jgi:hypothetical protein
MTPIQILDAVISCVEGGETGREVDGAACVALLGFKHLERSTSWVNAKGKLTGLPPVSTDLTAVHTLHKRVLPGWIGDVTTTGQAWVMGDQNQFYGVVPDEPAAAWLLAILKAIRAEMEASS